jgi:hypothetical protein
MKIADLPRPWFLAALTGVPMSVLLAQADEEDAKEQAGRRLSHDKRARSWQHAANPRCRRTRLADRFRLVV